MLVVGGLKGDLYFWGEGTWSNLVCYLFLMGLVSLFFYLQPSSNLYSKFPPVFNVFCFFILFKTSPDFSNSYLYFLQAFAQSRQLPNSHWLASSPLNSAQLFLSKLSQTVHFPEHLSISKLRHPLTYTHKLRPSLKTPEKTRMSYIQRIDL